MEPELASREHHRSEQLRTFTVAAWPPAELIIAGDCESIQCGGMGA
jgi:hypothetical protein